jgi:cob(I)alamin adenosyltransferase
VSKKNARIAAYGTIDELNSFIGVVRSAWPDSSIDVQFDAIQRDLFDIGAQLAAPGIRKFKGLTSSRVDSLEQGIDDMERRLAPLTNFILPGGSLPAAHLHVARTVCRRAERLVVALGKDAPKRTIAYLNRLSDYLFVAARFANAEHGVDDVMWSG